MISSVEILAVAIPRNLAKFLKSMSFLGAMPKISLTLQNTRRLSLITDELAMNLTFNHLDHVIDYMSMLMLRAEHDDLGV